MLIDWCDTLHVELRSDGPITREDLTTPLPADDLVLRAAKALAGLRPNPAGRPHRHRQGGPGAGRHGRRLLGCGHLPVGAQSPVGLESAAVEAGADRPGAGRRRALFPARAQCLGRRHRRADHADRAAAGTLCGRQAARGTGHPSYFCSAGSATGHARCYNLGLCCTQRVWRRIGNRFSTSVTTICSRLPSGFVPRSPRPSNGSVAKDCKARMTGSGSSVFAADAARSGTGRCAPGLAGSQVQQFGRSSPGGLGGLERSDRLRSDATYIG